MLMLRFTLTKTRQVGDTMIFSLSFSRSTFFCSGPGFSQEIDLHRHAEAVLNEAEFAPIPPQWVHMSAAAEPSKWGER